MAESKIEWTDYTHNPWWGCKKIYPECKNCYAESMFGNYKYWRDARRLFNAAHHAKPLAWNAKAEKLGLRKRVFCASMCDLFEDKPELDEPRAVTFRTMKSTQSLDWLLLTKRPENFGRMLPWLIDGSPIWPNVYLGISAGCQDSLDKLAPWLCQTPAAGRFLSIEPMLGQVSIGNYLDHVQWVICGSEQIKRSPKQARPMLLDWVRDLRDQCKARHVAFFFKQSLNSSGVKISMPELDGLVCAEYPAW